jgi:hypothetical protein
VVKSIHVKRGGISALKTYFICRKLASASAVIALIALWLQDPLGKAHVHEVNENRLLGTFLHIVCIASKLEQGLIKLALIKHNAFILLLLQLTLVDSKIATIKTVKQLNSNGSTSPFQWELF